MSSTEENWSVRLCLWFLITNLIGSAAFQTFPTTFPRSGVETAVSLTALKLISAVASLLIHLEAESDECSWARLEVSTTVSQLCCGHEHDWMEHSGHQCPGTKSPRLCFQTATVIQRILPDQTSRGTGHRSGICSHRLSTPFTQTRSGGHYVYGGEPTVSFLIHDRQLHLSV